MGNFIAYNFFSYLYRVGNGVGEGGGGGERRVAHGAQELKSKIDGSRELKQTFHESRTIQRLISLFTRIVDPHSSTKLTCRPS